MPADSSAIVQRRSAYVLDFTSPVGATPADKRIGRSGRARGGGHFRGGGRSVQFSIRRALIGTEERLYRTRTLLVSLPNRIKAALAPEQYFRVDAGRQGHRVDVCDGGIG